MSISLPPSVFSKFSSPNIRLSFSAFSDANLFPLSPQTNRNPRFQIGSPVIGANILDQALVGNVTISMILSNTVRSVKLIWHLLMLLNYFSEL